MIFVLEFLDTDLKKLRNIYFRTNIVVSSLNIIVTANTPLPFTLGLAMNPFGALISRIDTVHFEGFSEQDLKNFLTNIIDEMISKYDLVVEISLETYKSDLMNQAIVAQRQASGEEQIELRDLKKQLENLIM